MYGLTFQLLSCHANNIDVNPHSCQWKLNTGLKNNNTRSVSGHVAAASVAILLSPMDVHFLCFTEKFQGYGLCCDPPAFREEERGTGSVRKTLALLHPGAACCHLVAFVACPGFHFYKNICQTYRGHTSAGGLCARFHGGYTAGTLRTSVQSLLIHASAGRNQGPRS